MKFTRLPLSIGLTSSIILMPAATLKASNDDASQLLAPLIVTARYWEESAATVPASIAIINVHTIGSDLSGLDKKVSNVRVEESSVQTRINIRGAGGFDTGLQDPVGYYIDGVALPLGGTALPPLFNLASFEVIKGPQGSLYGRNSEAGVVKISTQSPSWQPSSAVVIEQGYTNGNNGYQPSSTVSVAGSNTLVKETLAGSIALRYQDRQGAFNNLNDGDKNGGASENWTLSAGLDAQLSDDTQVRYRNLLSKQNNGKSLLRYATGNSATERFNTNYDTATYDNYRSAVHSITVDQQLDDLSFISITGYSKFERDFIADLDLTPAPIPATKFNLDDAMISQEFRLSSADDQSLRWIAGLYLYDQETTTDFTIGGSAMLTRSNRATDISQQGAAVFGQLALDLNDSWEISLGSRVERIKKKGAQTYSTTNNAYKTQLNETQFLPKASLSYYPSDSSMFYASIAKGYTAGGFNYASAQNLNSFTYSAQTSINAEMGYKANLLEGALDVSAAVFHISAKDKQVSDLQPGFVQSIANAAQATSYGIEVSADYRISTALSLYAQLGLLHAEADQYNTNVFSNGNFVATSFAGNDLTMAPSYTYALGVKYDKGIGLFSDLTVTGSSDYYFDSANTLKQTGYNRIDAQLGYHFSNDLSLSMVGENLLDTQIYSRAVNTSAGIALEDTAARYIGLKLRGHW